MYKIIKSNTLKMAISSTIAIFISNFLGLEFAVTSGIIAILSIQNTKKEAINIGLKRIFAALIAIFLSLILFVWLGNSAIIFGLFLVIFISISKKIKIEEGIAVGAVLSTHLLTSPSINVYWIKNEIFLTLIGIGVAMIFNFVTVSSEEEFEKNRIKIEEKFKVLLLDMSESLMSQAVPIYQQKILIDLSELITETEYIANSIYNNYLFRRFDYYTKYMDMRIIQFDIIKKMNKHFSRFYMTYNQTKMLSDFTKNIALNISENNDCIELIKELNLLKNEYKNMELPRTRDEFENRALLFQFLNDLEEFLLVKKEFIILSYRR